MPNCRRARGRTRSQALEKEIVARAGGLSRAALIAEGLHVLPDFIGARSPSADAGARGGVMGMDLREDAASLQELYVAGLCGLAYGLADIVRKLERSGYEFDSIVVSGGAARSALVRQIIADVCGQDGGIAGDPGAGASGLRDGRRGRGGSTDHDLRDVGDVDDRARRKGAGRRGDRGVPRAKAAAFEMLRRTEREIRELDPQVPLA